MIEPPSPPAASQTATGCDIASQYDWNVNVAIAICKAESGGNPSAFNPSNSNGSNDAGLFQVNSIHVISGLIGDQERFDPLKNVAAAYKIYKGSGFTAWSAYNSNKHLKFL